VSTITQDFTVGFSYPVFFTENLFGKENNLFKEIISSDRRNGRRKILFVMDSGVSRYFPNLSSAVKSYTKIHRDFFEPCGEPVIIPGGEQSKNGRSAVEKILEMINNFSMCRHSYVAAIGGGAVLDAVGFAASIAHRGIRFIRIPTTVLSQNDAGIGVKNGINYFGKKNFLGTFSPPYAVINDSVFLTSLDFRDWRAGISEAIKVGLIKDREFLFSVKYLAEKLLKRDMEVMKGMIHRCAEIHLHHIAGKDPFETGTSRPLDFGHWSAHKLEQMTKYKIRHGEAVAAGMALDSTYSFLCGMLPESEWKEIMEVFRNFSFQTYYPQLSDREIFEGLDEFREHLGGRLTVMLLKKIGEGVEVNSMDKKLIRKAVFLLKKC
jgi:3-dehydroquinate synthase